MYSVNMTDDNDLQFKLWDWLMLGRYIKVIFLNDDYDSNSYYYDAFISNMLILWLFCNLLE